MSENEENNFPWAMIIIVDNLIKINYLPRREWQREKRTVEEKQNLILHKNDNKK